MENLTNICKYLSKYETWFSYLMLYRKLASVCQTTPTGSNKKTDSYGRSYKNLFTWHVSTRLTSGIWRSRGNNCWGNSNMQMTLKNLEAHGNTRCLKRLICWMVVRAMDSKRQEDEDIYIYSYIYTNIWLAFAPESHGKQLFLHVFYQAWKWVKPIFD